MPLSFSEFTEIQAGSLQAEDSQIAHLKQQPSLHPPVPVAGRGRALRSQALHQGALAQGGCTPWDTSLPSQGHCAPRDCPHCNGIFVQTNSSPAPPPQVQCS